MQLRDRTFLLLGGTGGIGQALVQPLLDTGARVVVASRTPEKINDDGVDRVRLDLAADDLPEQLASISSLYPQLDGVIHCAGQNQFSAIDQLDPAELDDLLRVNLRSALLVARHFVPRFSAMGRGDLVFVGSTFGSIGFPGYSAYCASKFGLRGFTEALRRELADTPIQVLYVAPRATRTDMNPERVNALNEALGNQMDDPANVAGQIIAAMKSDQRRRYLGWPERFFVVLNSLLPRLVDKAMLKQLPVVRRFLSGASQ
ncbi:SDR family oxidoreductase [Marinobacter zhejiangensis]|uniref:Short-chain dehydrogenase n=1 Tax=Marinobacter zhejiangensis TaxID=488535 RepID=A0A1I4M7N8_9GAMM|nr:SDR family oxidoreductase [Marinobacter zhejiangensis]SFL99180.1 Short-chain dehydrogenase [Marinobacter zhejiangensis]